MVFIVSIALFIVKDDGEMVACDTFDWGCGTTIKLCETEKMETTPTIASGVANNLVATPL